MKKVIKFFCLILMLAMTFSLVSCTSKDKDSDYKNAENAVKKYLNAYYTVDKNDIERYRVTLGTKDINELDKATKDSTEKFKPLLTNKAYETLYAERMGYLRVKDAYEKKCYVTVKSIKLEKFIEDKKQKMIGYTYYINLTETSIEGNETKDVKSRDNIHVFKVGNEWKVQ